MPTAKQQLEVQAKALKSLSEQFETLSSKIKKMSNKKQADQKLTSKINNIETKIHKTCELLKVDIDDLEEYL